MSSLLSVLNVARGGMSANSAGVAVTGENITGANQKGFVRRTALLETRVFGHNVAGGAQFMGVGRAFDQFSYRNVLRETAQLGHADARSSSLEQIERVITPTDGHTLGDRIAGMFTAFDELGKKPDDVTARKLVIQAAQDVSSGFRETSSRLSQSRGELLARAQGVAQEVNVRLERIAEYNDRIQRMQSEDSSGRAELIDQRDELVREVSERIDLEVVEGDAGAVTLLSSGSALVDDGKAASVQVSVDANNDLKIEFVRDGNALNVSSKLTGGSLGGIREARDTDVVGLQTDLDQFAVDFAAAMNTVHNTGIDLNGNAGLDLFTDPAGAALPAPPGTAFAFSLNPNIAGDSDLLGAATAGAPPPGGNDGAIALSQVSQSVIGADGTPSETFGALAGSIGNKLVAAYSSRDMRESTVAHADNLRQSISGVSLDEEMINLTKFQRAFDASMRVLQAADEMLMTLVQRL
jgi:flagellar hook-associated protein 1 FlgK